MAESETTLMTYTKIFAIRKRLKKSIGYVLNPEKTTMQEDSVEYSFESVLNCISPQSAYQEMMETKNRWGKKDGVQGYHLIQSFLPGEVTPEETHQLGVLLARQLFENRFEVVIGTHLDKAHLHNHIIVNSVSFVDGKKYHSSPSSYYNTIRAAADQLCQQRDLFVITPKKKGRSYVEWQAEQKGKQTIRSMIRADMDAAIEDAYNFSSFLALLQKRGYVVDNNPRHKYITVRPPGGKRAIRLNSLGDAYTENGIRERLKKQRNAEKSKSKSAEVVARKYIVRHNGSLLQRSKRRITGFLALYFRYVYLLRGVRLNKRVYSSTLRQEVWKLNPYQEQFLYLLKHNISTHEELEQQIKMLTWDIHCLTEERKPYYRKRKRAETEEERVMYTTEIQRYGTLLRTKRKELRICYYIQTDAVKITNQFAEIKQKQKEEKKHEYQWGNR